MVRAEVDGDWKLKLMMKRMMMLALDGSWSSCMDLEKVEVEKKMKLSKES